MKFFAPSRPNFTIFSTVLFVYLLVATVFDSKATISAKSANLIYGVAPTLVETSAQNKLGFTINGTAYNESLGNVSSTSTNLFESVTLNDFVVGTPNFDTNEDYSDLDGDVPHTITPFEISSMSYAWKDATGQVIPESDYDKDIACALNYARPLSLTIVVNDVKVNSQYGLPSSSGLYQLSKVYNISAKNSFCFAKPNSMTVDPSRVWLNTSSGWNSGSSTPSSEVGGGYRDDFDPINGFKTSSATKFPTTGFVNAKFQLIMAGNQSDYSYQALESDSVTSAVSVDANGVVTLNSKPSGAVVIRAKLNSEPTTYFDYSFNPTTVWAIPTRGPVSTVCSNSNFLTRQELTNSPYVLGPSDPEDGPGSPDFVTNYYTRTISGSLFGEWGVTTQLTYPNTNWPGNATSDDKYISTTTSGTPFVDAETGLSDFLSSLGGWVGGSEPQVLAACRG